MYTRTKRSAAGTPVSASGTKKQTPELDDLFERLYEDNVSGKISDERFATMSARYEAEQSKLKADAAKLSETISRKEQKDCCARVREV